MALRRALRRAQVAAPPPEAVQPSWPAPDWSAAPAPQPPRDEGWQAEPGFGAVALEEPPAAGPGAWTAAAAAIDVTDPTVDLPVLAAPPHRRAARAGRAALTLALVLGCAGGALAASGVLKAKHTPGTPPAIGSASVVAPARPHPAAPAHRRRVAHRQRRAHHRHAAAHRHAAVAPQRIVAAAPARPVTRSVPAPARTPVHRVASSPAPSPAPAPKPVASKPAPTPQPAASAPSGEPGRTPPPTTP